MYTQPQCNWKRNGMQTLVGHPQGGASNRVEMPCFETETSPFRVPFRNLPSEIPLGLESNTCDATIFDLRLSVTIPQDGDRLCEC